MNNWHQENWSGHVAFGAARFHQPTTVAEVQEIVRRADKVRVIGSRHCFNDIADTTGDLLWLGAMDNTVQIDAQRHTATVNAGITYNELCPQLHAAGYALPNMASLNHITVIGACISATHGSGNALGNLATVVSGLEMVTANGDLVTLSREKDGDTFLGSVVALGALGVVTKVTLDLQPAFWMQQNVYEKLPMDDIYEHFDEITSAGYSVSLFPTWQFDWSETVWVKQKLSNHQPIAVPETFFGATLGSNDRPVADDYDRVLTRFGVAIPWHECLPHFNFKDAMRVGNELQSEYFVPRQYAVDAMKAVSKLRPGLEPVLGVTEVRTVAADKLWLSPAYEQEIVGIHFNWLKKWEGVRAMIPLIEDAIAPFEPRPHWGKLFSMTPAQVQSRYKRIADFRALMLSFDPRGKFRNRFVETFVL